MSDAQSKTTAECPTCDTAGRCTYACLAAPAEVWVPIPHTHGDPQPRISDGVMDGGAERWPRSPATTAPGENSPAMDNDALAAELAADPAIAASLAEWEPTSGPPQGEYSPRPAWDGRGVPAHVSGYHWVRRIDVPGHDMHPVIWTWRADAQVWRWGHREMQPAEMAAHMEWMGRVAAHNVAHDLAAMVREVERLRRIMSEIVTRCDPGILGTADRGVIYAVALAKEGLANAR